MAANKMRLFTSVPRLVGRRGMADVVAPAASATAAKTSQRGPIPLSSSAPSASAPATATTATTPAPKRPPPPPPPAAVAPTSVPTPAAPAPKSIESNGNEIFDTLTVLQDAHTEAVDFTGMAAEPFPPEVAKTLLAPVDPKDVEIKPDGMIYLPEIKYRRILLRAFGPGGWALMPRGPHSIQGDDITREYALYAFGRFVSQARGEQQFFKGSSLATATEGCKSNALMRCCKDLGIAGELWDPSYILEWKKKYAVQVWVENARTKSKSRMWRRADRPAFEYPNVEQANTK